MPPERYYNCNACDVSFNHSPRKPLALGCGHSFCRDCVKQYCCPKCSPTLKESDIGNMGTARCSFKEDYCISTETIFSIGLCTVGSKNHLERKIVLQTLNCGHKVCKLCVKKYCPLTCKYMRVIKDNKITIDESHRLKHIYLKIEKGQKFRYFDYAYERTLFGRITTTKDMFFFHSLDEHETRRNTSYVQFCKIREELVRRKLNTFVVFTNEKAEPILVVIEMFKNKRTNYFINCCTGQCGPSFKTKRIRMELQEARDGSNHLEMLHVINDDWAEPSKSKFINYVPSLSDFKLSDLQADQIGVHSPGSVFVTCESHVETANFSLIYSSSGHLPEGKAEEAVGKVMYSLPSKVFLNFFDIKPRNILDCGIAIKM